MVKEAMSVKNYHAVVIIFYFLSALCIGLGFLQMNRYLSGDLNTLIMHTTITIGLLIIAVGALLIGSTAAIILEIRGGRPAQQPVETTQVQYLQIKLFKHYIAGIFTINRNLYQIQDWTPDTRTTNGVMTDESVYEEPESSPDFLVSYIPTDEHFAVKCIWRGRLIRKYKNEEPAIAWSSSKMMQAVAVYRQAHIPVFMLIGLEGTPDYPKYEFCLPLDAAPDQEIPVSLLKQYRRIPPGKPFLWKEGTLS
jgi:hypothetical protein